MSELHEIVDPLSYPLLFPKGKPLGWTTTMIHSCEHQSKNAKRTRLTVLQFYAHQLMRREGASILPHAAGKLFQQYCVDAYCKAEGQRLCWMRNNQGLLRSEDYGVLKEYVVAQAARSAAPATAATALAPTVGRPVVLPSSFSGGTRAMQQNYQDAMAIVRGCGKPDYFLTFTASPTWPEIADNLAPGDTAANRPDLVARVFHLKFKAFLAVLLEQHVLGVAEGYAWTIEFQKRGLPHAHLLLIMRSADKPRTATDIDRVVCAELPDKENPDQLELYETVTGSLVHGPCGQFGAQKPCCNEHGICSKGFPMDFSETTVLVPDKYPTYRRREDGRTITKSGVQMDNRWVVPYNPYLVKLFKAHINVQVCTSIRCVKYLYKYIHKGHDRAAVEVVGAHDEIRDFLDARYVGPPEACWRLLSFEMHGKSHVVEKLPVHLPGQQVVLFDEEAARGGAIEAVGRRVREFCSSSNERGSLRNDNHYFQTSICCNPHSTLLGCDVVSTHNKKGHKTYKQGIDASIYFCLPG